MMARISFDTTNGSVGIASDLSAGAKRKLARFLSDMDPEVRRSFTHDTEVLMDRIAAAVAKSEKTLLALDDALANYWFDTESKAEANELLQVVEVALWLPSAQHMPNRRKR